MTRPNRIVARIQIGNPQDVPAKYVRKYESLGTRFQRLTRGGDGVLLHRLAQRLSFVHNFSGNVVTYSPKATKRVMGILAGMGLKAVVEFGRMKQNDSGDFIDSEKVNQKKYADLVAAA